MVAWVRKHNQLLAGPNGSLQDAFHSLAAEMQEAQAAPQSVQGSAFAPMFACATSCIGLCHLCHALPCNMLLLIQVMLYLYLNVGIQLKSLSLSLPG